MSACRLTILDCGASRVAAGTISRSRGRLHLEDFAVVRFEAIGRDDAWMEQTKSAFLALRGRIRPVGRILLILPPHATLAKSIFTPRVRAAKREKIIRFEAAHAMPCPLSELAWDTVKAGETQGGCAQWLVAAKLSTLVRLAELATESGFDPDELMPAPLATLGAVRLARTGQDETVLVLNLGARTTTILQVAPGRFASRGVPLAAQALATDAGATRLAQEITRSVLYFNRQDDAPPPTRVCLMGGGSRQAGLATRLAGQLVMPVELIDLQGRVEFGRAAAAAGAEGSMTEWTDLVGAAATWHGPDVRQVNLLPMNLRCRAWARRRRPWLVAAALIAVAALLPPSWHYRQVEAAVRTKTVAVESALAPLRERAARMREAQITLTELQAQLEILQALRDRRTAWVELLADLQDRMVRVGDVWFDRWRTHPTANGSPLKLAVSGRMFDRSQPLATISPEAWTRVRRLLDELVASPFVGSIEGERFDASQPGMLRFEFVLVTDPSRPL